ncbi:hypothetical protein OC842_003264 [Tilletia horrida]|uniref:Uncharacterized protein n=1 Tax=Tilletia horrida TaxID=155126 RepID=A0AAN6GDX0_9BASI|nr:hypothetical protein OC842_003264 [Tilletia horrida]
MLPNAIPDNKPVKVRQLSTPLSHLLNEDAGRHSATLPRQCYVFEHDSRFRSMSSGPELILNGPKGSSKSRSGKMMMASHRSPLGFDVPELIAIGPNDDDPRALSKFSSFKASSRAIGAKLKSILAPRGKPAVLKLDDAVSRRDSSEYDTSNSSSNTAGNSTRNLSFSRSTLSRWNGSQGAGSVRRDSPLRQLFDPFDANAAESHSIPPRQSLSSVGAHSVLNVPNGPNSFLNEPPPPLHTAQRSFGRMGGAKTLRALTSIGRLRDTSRLKMSASPPKPAIKRHIDEVAPSPTAIAFPTEATHVRSTPQPLSPATSSRHRARGRTGSDARSSRRRVPSNASSQGRRRVPSRAPPASLPTIVDVKTFRISERDSWIHIEDAARSQTDLDTEQELEQQQQRATPSTPLLYGQESGSQAQLSPRLPTFSFTPPMTALVSQQSRQGLPPNHLSPANSPIRMFHFSATPSSVLLPGTMSPPIPSLKISTASDVVCNSSQAIDAVVRRLGSQSFQNLQQSSQALMQSRDALHHQASRDSLPFPPRTKRYRATTVSSRNSSCTGLSSADERSPAHGSKDAATPTDHTMTSLRTVSSSILYYGADMTPSRARPASMMQDVDGQDEATEVLRQKLGMLSVRPRPGAPGSAAVSSTSAPTEQTSKAGTVSGRVPSRLPIPVPAPKPQQPLPPLPSGAQNAQKRAGADEAEESEPREDIVDVGDNTLTDAPAPHRLSRGGPTGSSNGIATSRQNRISSSGDSIASILSYVSTVVSSTESEDIQSLIDGVSADCHEGTIDPHAHHGALDNEAAGVEQRARLNGSSASVASSAFSGFELTTALALSNLPRAKVSSFSPQNVAGIQQGVSTSASHRPENHAAPAQPHLNSMSMSSATTEGDRTVGRPSKIPLAVTAAQRRDENEAPGSLREALTLRFPLPKPMRLAEGSSRSGPAGGGPSANGSNYYPPTSFSRHIHAQLVSQQQQQQQHGMQGDSSLANGSYQQHQTSGGTDGQMLKRRTSNSAQSHHSHLSLVLAHLEESPCPPPRRRRAPKILGPSAQANF